MMVLSLAIKGALVLALAGAGACLLRGTSASARHAVWVTAFVALLALPLLTVFGPALELAVLPNTPTQTAESAPGAPPALLAPPAPLAPIAAPPAPPAPPAVAPLPLPVPLAVPVEPALAPLPAREVSGLAVGNAPGLLARLWAAGALAVLLGWLATMLAARHLVSRSRQVTDARWLEAFERARLLSEVDGPVRLLRSDGLAVPVAWGWGRPAVVLPATSDEWDDERREAVLLHELAHLARNDARTQLVAQLAVALHWFDPLAWWAYRQMLEERERACDDAVLRGGATPSTYAGHLVAVARGLKRRHPALAGFAPMARRSHLEGRVLSILGDRQRAALSRIGAASLGAIAGLLVLPLGACQLTSRPAEPAVVYTATGPRVHVSAEQKLAEARARLAEAATEVAQAERELAHVDLGGMHEHVDDLHVDLSDLHVDLSDLEESLSDLPLDLAHMPEIEISMEKVLRDALQTLESVQFEDLEEADIDWDEVREDIREAYEEALEEIEEATEEAREHRGRSDWRSERDAALRDAERARARAVEQVRRDLARTERQQREAEARHRRVREKAQRAAERAQREAERARRDAERQRNRQPDGLQSFNLPSAPPAAYSFGFTTDGTVTVAVGGGGAGAWAGSLEGWQAGVASLARQVETAQSAQQLSRLQSALAGMRSGLAGLEAAGHAWAQSPSEHEIVNRSIEDARESLDKIEHDLADTCVD